MFSKRHIPSLLKIILILGITLSALMVIPVKPVYAADCANNAGTQYRSAGTGNWNAAATWECSDDGINWQVPTTNTPTSANSTITIRNGNIVTATANVTVDQVTIDAGGQLIIDTGVIMTLADGAGTDLTVNGTLVKRNTIALLAASNIVFGPNSLYHHDEDGSSVPIAAWDPTSTVMVTGMTTNYPGNMTQTFGNLIWNNPGQLIDTTSTLFTVVGNLTIQDTGAFEFRFGGTTGVSTNTVGGNYTQTGGFVRIGTGTARTLSVTGNFSLSGGRLRLSDGGQPGTLNVAKDFSHTGGLLTEVGASTTSAVVFNGITVQNFTFGGTGSVTNEVGFTVNSGSTLYLGTSIITGNGDFTLSSGAALGIGSADGIRTAGVLGNVQVSGATSSRVFNPGATYIYNGTVSQVTGDALPATVANLTINNSSGVALTNTVTVTGTLTLTSGIVTTGAPILIVDTTGIATGGSPSSYVFGNLRKNFAAGPQSFTFPIGDATNYTPVTLSIANVTAPGNVTATTTVGQHPNIASSTLSVVKDVNRYWTLTPAGGLAFSFYDATFNFVPTDILNGADPNAFVVQRYAAGWTTPTTGTRTATSTQATGLTAFGDFAVGELTTGTIYYVNNLNPACSDLGTGLTIPLPFCTIGKGASVAVAGNTVRVLAGTYAETIVSTNSGSAGFPITYTADPGVTVTGNSGNGFTINTRSYITIDGFTITAPTGHGIFIAASNNISILNNAISDAGAPASGFTRSGIIVDTTSNSLIDGNTTSYNSQDGIRLNDCVNITVSNNVSFGNAEVWQRNATGIQVRGALGSGNMVIHNITYGNEDSGIQFYTGTHDNFLIGNVSYGNGGHGFDANNSANNLIVGNSFQGNHEPSINLEAASTGSTVVNNISMDNGIAPLVGFPANVRISANSTTGTTFNYNLFYMSVPGVPQVRWSGTDYLTLAAFQLATGQEANGLEANPLFIAPVPYVTGSPAVVPGDLHLNPGSPAIDSANSSALGEPATDLDGNARIDDPATANTGVGVDDRGAYEFQPGAKLTQLITFGALANKTFGDVDFSVSATSSSGLTVTFVASGNCTVAVNVVHLTGAGSCTITAQQAGNATYLPAADVSQSFTIGLGTPVITWANPANITYGTALSGTQLNATASVPGAFTYTPASGTVLNAGNGQTLSVDFVPTDTTNYNSVLGTTVTINVLKATPVITWANPADITYGTALSGAQLNATTPVPGAFTYTPASGTVLNAGNGQILSVDFVPTDTTNYNSVLGTTVTINVLKATPVITWANPANITYGTALSGTQLNATASVPGAFTYSPASGTVLNAGNGQTLSVDFVPTDTANYNNVLGTTVTINVLKATPTVTWANPANITYGTALSGTQLNATASVPGAFTYTPASGTVLNAGNGQTLSVDFVPTDTTNYNSVLGTTVTINVLRATPTVSWSNPADITYGTALSGVQLNATASVPGAFTYTPASGTILNAGNGQILSVDFVPTDTTNYNSVLGTTVTINVMKATPTVTWANPANITYGTALSGVQLNATASVLGAFTYTPASGTVLNAGNGQTLSVDFVPTDTTNYNSVLGTTVTINVIKANVTVTWANPADITYGTALGGTQLNATASVPGTFTYTPAAGTVLNAGNGQVLSVDFVPTDTTNYNSVLGTTVTINVLKLTPTVSWSNPADITYGTALSGVQLNAIASVPGAFAYTPASGTVLNAGNGQILSVDFVPTDTTNYNSVLGTTVTINVLKATPTVTWANPADITYGTALSGIQLNATASVPGAFTYTPASGTVLNAGNGQILSVDFVPTDTTNYNSVLGTTVTINVLKATPTVTWANPADITYGTALSGVQLNATASVLGAFTYTPASGTVLSAGNGQTLSVDFVPTDTANYNSVLGTTVTINVLKATPTVTWANPADITYGTALSGTQLNATASVPGAFTYTPASGTVLSAGNGQVLSVDFVPTDTANYNSVLGTTVTINVLLNTPVVTWANPADITYGTALSGGQLNATASVPGAFTYTPASGTILTAGNGQILSVDFVPTDTANYNSVLGTTVTINVLKANQAITITTGAPASAPNGTSFTVAATGGASGNPVIYSVGVGSSCTNVGATFTMTAATGTCIVQYDQAGDANYNAAPQVVETVNAGMGVVTITLEIHDASEAVITTALNGAIVHAQATLTGLSVTPTGNVNFYYYNNTTCSGAGTAAGTITLAAGVGHPSSTATLTDAGLSFNVHYNGDVNYSTADSGCVALSAFPRVLLTAAGTNPKNGDVITAPGPNQLKVEFNKDVLNNGTANAANFAGNYVLVEDGLDGFFQTTNCLLGADVNDTKITVNSVIYANGGGVGPFVSTLNVNGGTPLPVGKYSLFVCGTTSINDLLGNELNGGTTDTTITFTVNAVPVSTGPTATALPATGFAPGVYTKLPVQLEQQVYADLGDLWMEIPSLGVKISIVGVPLVNGTWDVSWLWNQVGYLEGTSFPTWAGNSVITGHVYLSNGKPGPFIGIRQLRWGDQIIVHAFGQAYTYEVRSVQSVRPNAVKSVITHEDKSVVTLLSCQDYDEKTKTYRYRTVVRAILISVK